MKNFGKATPSIKNRDTHVPMFEVFNSISSKAVQSRNCVETLSRIGWERMGLRVSGDVEGQFGFWSMVGGN
jgi:hypothetical protein